MYFPFLHCSATELKHRGLQCLQCSLPGPGYQTSPAEGGSPHLLSELLQEAVPVALQRVSRQTCEKKQVQSSPCVPIPGGNGSGASL